MSRNLVIGASGLIGSHLLSALRAKGQTAIGTCLSRVEPGLVQLDLLDKSGVDQFLSDNPADIVYFPAANPNVEWIEENPHRSRELNVDAAKQFLRTVISFGSKIVYFSTEYVFDGAGGPYVEDDATNPLSEYGKQKLEMEEFMQQEAQDGLVLRVTVVYGWERQPKNFAHRLVQTLRDGGPSISVPDDQISSPTYAPNLAEASIELASSYSGKYHVCGSERCSRFEFAHKIAEAFDLPTHRLVPVKTESLNQQAVRPLNAGMIVDKARATLSIPLVSYSEGIRAMKATEVIS